MEKRGWYIPYISAMTTVVFPAKQTTKIRVATSPREIADRVCGDVGSRHTGGNYTPTSGPAQYDRNTQASAERIHEMTSTAKLSTGNGNIR